MRYLLTIAFLLMATPCFAVLTKTYTIKESGGDYTTLASAESAHDQDLVANDSALTFEISGTWTVDDGFATIAGWTTDATRFLTITAVGASRASATFSTTAYRIVRAEFNVLRVHTDYTVVDGIQVNVTGSAATTARCIGSTTGAPANWVVKNCFLKGGGGSAQWGVKTVDAAIAGIIVRNTVIIDCGGGGVDAFASAGGIAIDNNTIENCGIGIQTAANDAIARNNILWNTTTPLSGDFNTSTLSEENFTDASSLSYGSCGSCGTGDQVSQSDPFENIGGENYLLASGSTPIDAGKDLSGDFTDAIGGKTRDANFDKGADEFIAAAGGQKVMIRK